jgi:LemA protein
MSTFEDKLNKHIDKVLDFQRNQEEKMLSLEELKEIDKSLGVTEEEWMQMMAKADNEAELAQEHFYYKNFSDAYKTAESAILINPHLTKALIIMADAALKIYETEDDEEYLLKAEKHANDILKQAPTEKRAVEILAVLSNYKKSEKKQRSNLIKIITGSLIVLALILTIIFWPREEKPVQLDESIKFELIDAEETVNAKWAQVENVISRRDNLIPQLFELVNKDDEDLNALKNEINILQEEITQAEVSEKVELQASLQDKYAQLTRHISDTNKDENIATLMIQIEGSYNRISVEAKRYNDAVRAYNTLVKKYASDHEAFSIKPYFKGN